jgi:uncharacterized protein (TIGR02217 family)
MAFYETPRFPDRIAMGAVGGPRFDTRVAVVGGGAEQRNGQWSYPMHAWDVSQGIRNQADFETLRAFFLTMRGRLHGWRFKDWTDYSAVHTSGFVSGITGTTFQLVKRYTSGAQTLDRKIGKPLASGFVLKDTGVTLTLTTDYTLNTVTGVVTTVITRTAANLTWAGEFDVPMRFDTDALQARIESRNPSAGLLHRWDSIPVREIRT